MANISSTYVPDEGPDDARILFVGEAPGEDETSERRPFVGRSGQFLERYMGRVGLERDSVKLANLCHYQPPNNQFGKLLGSSELLEGLGELDRTIERVNPNIIIALGNWSNYYLTGNTSEKGGPGTGIMSWRGSVVPGVGTHIPSAEGRKIITTFHPTFVVRAEGFGYHPIFRLDLAKAVRHSSTRDIVYPQYHALIDPPNVWDVVKEMEQAEWLSVDIETFGNRMACCGFADSEGRAMCITTNNPEGFTPAQSLLTSKAKKIFQFGTFDVNYLWKYYSIETRNFTFDTYIAASNLMPEFSKGLAFLASIYTDFPYYKEDRKVWKATGDLSTLWQYNLKDCIATYMNFTERGGRREG
jgi:uracil-DNA glycosylase family 4